MQRRATWRIVAARRVRLERHPGRLCADVPVDACRERHGLGQRRPEAALDLGADPKPASTAAITSSSDGSAPLVVGTDRSSCTRSGAPD